MKTRAERNAAMRAWRGKNPEKVKASFRAWRLKNPNYYDSLDFRKRRAINAAKSRAKAAGIPFSIALEHLDWPQVCPVLGITLDYFVKDKAAPASISLDRTDPNLGYIPGNVVVMSHRANFLKKNATLLELVKLGVYGKAMMT